MISKAFPQAEEDITTQTTSKASMERCEVMSLMKTPKTAETEKKWELLLLDKAVSADPVKTYSRNRCVTS